MLGLLVRATPTIAFLHSISCLLIGLYIALARPRRELAYLLAYIATSEVLWRMGHGTLFHEYGKYVVVVLVSLSLLRFPPRRNRAFAIGYMLLLLPSMMLTFLTIDFDNARKLVSFNLSGPLSLGLGVLFFSQLKISREQFRLLLFLAIGPVLAIATFSAFSTFAREDIEFLNNSNFASSGGFGPNQVSAALGLGVVFSLLLLFERKVRLQVQLTLITIAAFFAIQATLTFSRGGLVMAAASIVVALLFLVRDRRSRLTLFVVALTFATAGYYVVYPRLVNFTNGKVTERYTNTDASNRVTFAQYDLEIFEEHPVFGVGPGMATQLREDLGVRGIAHTEYTRMLSEHGILGALALVLLVALGIRTMRTTHQLIGKAVVAALLVWFVQFMLINAMRLVAPAIVFGLACAIASSSKAWGTRTS